MTRRFDVSTSPVNFANDLNLVAGNEYTIEVVAGHKPARLWESAQQPTDLSAFHTLAPGVPSYVTVDTSLGLWIWCSQSAGSTVVVVSDYS